VNQSQSVGDGTDQSQSVGDGTDQSRSFLITIIYNTSEHEVKTI